MYGEECPPSSWPLEAPKVARVSIVMKISWTDSEAIKKKLIENSLQKILHPKFELSKEENLENPHSQKKNNLSH